MNLTGCVSIMTLPQMPRAKNMKRMIHRNQRGAGSRTFYIWYTVLATAVLTDGH